MQYCLSGELHLLDAAKLTVQLMKPVVLPAGAANGNGAAAGGPPPLLLTAGKSRFGVQFSSADALCYMKR